MSTNPVLAEALRLNWLLKVRPASFAAVALRHLRRESHRTIVDTKWGLRFYLDPLSNLGHSFLTESDYEPDTVSLFHSYIRPGDIVVDIGANEGVFSCLAALISGPTGRVIAVEPQARLADIIAINACLNAANVELINKALSDDSTTVELRIYPTVNTGASSIVSSYGWSNKTQVAETVSFSEILTKRAIEKAGVVKVDVEGYEREVVTSMLPSIRDGKVGVMFIDYHDEVLKSRGIKRESIHADILSAGMICAEGSRAGYNIYRLPDAR